MSLAATQERPSVSGTLGLVALLALCWSAGPALGRIAGQAGIPALVFLAFQAWGGALILGGLAAFGRKAPGIGPRHLALYAVSGLFGHALPQIVSFLAVQRLPVGIIGLVISINPIVTFAVALAVGVERFSLRRGAAILLGFAGALLVILPRASLPDRTELVWTLSALSIPICFAVANVFAARLRPQGSDPRANGFGMMAASGLFLSCSIAMTGESYWPSIMDPGPGDLSLLAIAAIAGLTFFLYFAILERAGPVALGSASYLILVLTNVWGSLFFGEQPTIWLAAAIAVIATALVLMQTEPKKDARRPCGRRAD